MATFLNDTFTGAGNLATVHVGEVGATWTKHPSSGTGTMGISSGAPTRLRMTNAVGTVFYYASGVPASADYEVTAPFTVESVLSTLGICGRMDTAANTMYCLQYVTATTQWQLIKMLAGVQTTLATFNQTLTAGQTYNLRLYMRGTTLKGYVNEVERLSATDPDITAAGKAGVRAINAASDSTGFALESITALDVLTHNIAVSGGGALSSTATTSRSAANVVTGGGVPIVVGLRKTGTSVGVSGGGSLVTAGAHRASTGAPISGDGSVVASGTKGARASGMYGQGDYGSGDYAHAVVIGGGVPAAVGQKGSSTQVATSAAGSVLSVGAKGGLGQVVISANGGVVSTGRRTVLGAAALSAGGTIVLSGWKATFAQALVSAGGFVVVVGNSRTTPVVVPPTDVLFTSARTRVVEEDPTTAATVENPHTTAALT